MEAALYYIPFTEYPLYAIDEKRIEDERYRITVKFNLSTTGGKYQYMRIVNMCSKGICPGKIDQQVITLLMILNGKKIYLDKQGVVKNGSRQHYIEPGDFVWLWEFIERNMVRSS